MLTYIFNTLSLLLILLTPSYFYNDTNSFLDKIILFFIVLNLSYKLLVKSINRNHLLILAFLNFSYVILTVTSNEELEYYQLRIFNLFFNNYRINFKAFIYIEIIWMIIFVIISITQLLILYKLFKLKKRNVSN